SSCSVATAWQSVELLAMTSPHGPIQAASSWPEPIATASPAQSVLTARSKSPAPSCFARCANTGVKDLRVSSGVGRNGPTPNRSFFDWARAGRCPAAIPSDRAAPLARKRRRVIIRSPPHVSDCAVSPTRAGWTLAVVDSAWRGARSPRGTGSRCRAPRAVASDGEDQEGVGWGAVALVARRPAGLAHRRRLGRHGGRADDADDDLRRLGRGPRELLGR